MLTLIPALFLRHRALVVDVVVVHQLQMPIRNTVRCQRNFFSCDLTRRVVDQPLPLNRPRSARKTGKHTLSRPGKALLLSSATNASASTLWCCRLWWWLFYYQTHQGCWCPSSLFVTRAMPEVSEAACCRNSMSPGVKNKSNSLADSIIIKLAS